MRLQWDVNDEDLKKAAVEVMQYGGTRREMLLAAAVLTLLDERDERAKRDASSTAEPTEADIATAFMKT